jgi:hypothetical protein
MWWPAAEVLASTMDGREPLAGLAGDGVCLAVLNPHGFGGLARLRMDRPGDAELLPITDGLVTPVVHAGSGI